MPFIKNSESLVGKTVILNKEVKTCGGRFTVGSKVKIIDVGPRGYDIQDDEGNRAVECGFTGFYVVGE